MKKIWRAVSLALGVCMLMPALSACGGSDPDPTDDGKEPEDYGTLTIADITLTEGESAEIEPVFSVATAAMEITYSFDGQNIAIANGTVSGLVGNTVTTVTASTAHHEATFNVTVTEKITEKVESTLTVTAPDIYTNYPAKALTIQFSDPADEEPITYTVETKYASKVFIEDGKIRATGSFSTAFESVSITATTSTLETTFTVRVAQFDGSGPSGNSLNMETRAQNFLATWESKGAQTDSVLFVGDSFFDPDIFWTNFYSNYFGRKNAFCFGVSSATTTDWEILSERLVYPLAPKAIVIHCGTNNIFDDGKNATTTTADILRLIQLYLDNTNAQVYFFGIEPRIGSGDTAGNMLAESCNEAVIDFCNNESRATYLDSPAFCKNADGSINTSFYRDTVHPTLANYAQYVEALEDAGITYESSAAALNRTIADVESNVSQNISTTTRQIFYRGLALTNNYVLDGKIEITAAGSNPHMQFSFDGTNFSNRYLLWDSNSDHTFGLGYAKNGGHTNEQQTNGQKYTLTNGQTLEIYFRIAVVNGTAYFFFGDGAGNYTLEDSWSGVPTAEGLRIGMENLGARVTAMSAVTLEDDADEFAAIVSTFA